MSAVLISIIVGDRRGKGSFLVVPPWILIGLLLFRFWGAVPAAKAGPVPHYLIVTAPELAEAFGELAAYRGSNGYAASVVTLTNITNAYPSLDLPAGIRSWARDAGLATTNDMLVIGGDQDIVPARLCKPRAEGDVMPTDLYFADMSPATWDEDGDGFYGESGEVTVSNLSPTIAVGRIPVRTPGQAEAYVAKLLRYEATPPGTAPASMLLVGGGYGITGTARPADFRYHEFLGDREIAQMTLYRNGIQPWWQAGPLHWIFESASTWDQNRYGDYPLTRLNLAARLNQPYLYVSYGGHANRKRWFIAGGQNFSRDDLLQLTNSFPFINLPGGCGTCYHDDLDDPCMSEAALRNPNGGAVAWFGFVRPAAGIQRDALMDHLFKMPAATLGQIHAAALRSVAKAALGNPYEQYNLVLHGDPAVRAPAAPSGRQLDLFCPRGAEIVATGDPFVIRWNAWGTGFATEDRVRLEYSTNGTSWQVIPGAESLPYNARAHTWDTADLPESRDYHVRLASLEQPGLATTSPPFSIRPSGLLVVRASPVPAVQMGGSHGLRTDYDISVPIGDTAQVIAPELQGVVFAGWRDGAGLLLSTNPNYAFVFTTNTTCVATYSPLQEIVYYVNDDLAEYGIAPGDDANDGRTPATPMRSIQALLDRYPSAGYGAVVFVSEGTFEENLVLNAAHVGLVLRGAGRTQSIIDGGQRGPCVNAQAWQQGQLEHLGFENGRGTTHGGAVQMSGASLTIQDCFFGGNTAPGKGGAIYLSDSWADRDLVVRDSEFVDNTANRGGVLFAAKSGRVVITNCVFRGNFSAAGAGGGGVFQIGIDSSVELTDCLFEDNNTPDNGGAIRHSSSQTSVLQRCRFVRNTAGGGGAIHVSDSGGVVLSDCTFTNNSAATGGAVGGGAPFSATDCIFADNAATDGGALSWSLAGDLAATNCLFADNLATNYGGALALVPLSPAWPSVTFQGCQFVSNQAGDSSGAIRVEGGDLLLSQSLLASNRAVKSGVLGTSGSPRVTMHSCRVACNSADYSGVMRLTGTAPQVRCTDCEFVNNSALHDGGVLNGHVDSLLELHRCQLIGNTSDTGGALRVRNSATVRATDCLLARNRATTGLGGAVYAYESGNFHALGCTLVDNESADKGGGVAWISTGTLALTNSIVFYNRASQGSENLYQASTGVVQLANLCMTPAPANGVGHITNAPLFVNYAGGDLRLQSNSPCINAGLNLGTSNGLDLDGRPRVVSGTVDLGAYEFQGTGSVISYAWLQQFGLPTDGSADFAHADSDLLNNWQEWVALTNPTNPASCFRIEVNSLPPAITVGFASAPGRLYTLQVCTNASQRAWADVANLSLIPGTGERLQLVDTNRAAAGFYRVGIRLP